MRGGQSVYRLHAELAERARSRQPGQPGRAGLPGQRRGLGQPPLPWERQPAQKPEPELGLNEQGMPVAV
ncbi:hypothetical protein ES703_72112 [subsurface metagenome]